MQTNTACYCSYMWFTVKKELHVQKAVQLWFRSIDIGGRCRSADKIIWSCKLVLSCDRG